MNILDELKADIEVVVKRYEGRNFIHSEENDNIIKHIKQNLSDSNLASLLARDLREDTDKLIPRFFGFMKFVSDPIRRFRKELCAVLDNPKYSIINLLFSESQELYKENKLLLKSISDLQGKLQEEPEFVSDIDDLKKEMVIFRNKIFLLEDVNLKLQQQCRDYDKQLTGVIAEKNAADDKVKELKTEYDRLKVKYLGKVSTILTLEKEIEELKKERSQNSSENKRTGPSPFSSFYEH